MEIIGEVIVKQLNHKDIHNNIDAEQEYKLIYTTDSSRIFIYTLVNDKIYGLQLSDHRYFSSTYLQKLSYLDDYLQNIFSGISENSGLFIKIEQGYVYLYMNINSWQCYSLYITNNTYLENNKDLFTIQSGYILK